MIKLIKKWWATYKLRDKPVCKVMNQAEINKLEELCYRPLDYKKDNWRIRTFYKITFKL